MDALRDDYDVVVVGSGAGGGPLTLTLARAGLRVLVLEKGPRHGRAAYDHRQGLQPGDFVPPIDQDPHTVVTRRTTVPKRMQLGWIATCVGGGTVHMGGYLYRFHPDDFRMRRRFGPYLELADWPYGYDELEPYYARAEWQVGVAGSDEPNPFAGPRSRPYPLPPLDAHPIAERLVQACRARALHPFPTPRSINSRPYRGRPACTYCRLCASYGCPVGARGSSQEALLARAEATGRCTVCPEAMVREILTGSAGQATGCVVAGRDGIEHRVRARLVCVCASAIESARLLLLSRSARFPNGLANGSGLVGRHLQFHAVTMGQAWLDPAAVPELARDAHPFLGRSVMDHYFLPDGVSDLAKGGLLRFGLAPTGLEQEHDHASASRPIYFEAFHDFIPNRHTYVTLDPDVRDRWGIPVARIHLDRPEHHRAAGRWLLDRGFEIFSDLGAVKMQATDVGGTSSYLVHGTCRAGDDPATSVLDRYCRAHEVPNLYVVDGSFMPTSGGAPPTLTILANSFRTADHLVLRFREGAFD